jgi:hypothetical protein
MFLYGSSESGRWPEGIPVPPPGVRGEGGHRGVHRGDAAGSLAAPAIQQWSVSDGLGHGWGLSLFEQPDPDFAPGWRLRLNARTPGVSLDHQRPLMIGDGLGGAWKLANHSEELVARGEGTLPAGSGQFDATDPDPRPRDVLPLQLTLPLADGTTLP